jgi:hypothetical protein
MSTRRNGPVRKPSGGTHRPRVRRSRRVVRHVDTGSVLKFSAVFYLTLACIIFVAGVVLWIVATVVGVRENVERFIGDLIASNKFHFVGWEVLRVSAVVAVVLVILGTAFNLFLAVVYNLISEMVGGMAIIVDDEEPGPAKAGVSSSTSLLRPAGEIKRVPDGAPIKSAAAAAAAAAAPVANDEGERAIARWVPKRDRRV